MYELEFPLLDFEEGFREKPYYCINGYPTIGYGTKIGALHAPLELFAIRVDTDAAFGLMIMELKRNDAVLTRYDWFNSLCPIRKAIIRSMCYQMGVSGVLRFNNTIAAISLRDWQKAYDEMLDSHWYREDTPGRAQRHADVVLSGEWSSVPEYKPLYLK